MLTGFNMAAQGGFLVFLRLCVETKTLSCLSVRKILRYLI